MKVLPVVIEAVTPHEFISVPQKNEKAKVFAYISIQLTGEKGLEFLAKTGKQAQLFVSATRIVISEVSAGESTHSSLSRTNYQ